MIYILLYIYIITEKFMKMGNGNVNTKYFYILPVNKNTQIVDNKYIDKNATNKVNN